jgi:diacylglycerol kinase
MQSLGDAADGVARALREQRNFRVQIVLAVLAVAGAAWLHFSTERWALLALTIGVVLSAELINTALERALDAAVPNHSDAVRAAKHAAAAAVLVASIGALAVGAWLFGGALEHR